MVVPVVSLQHSPDLAGPDVHGENEGRQMGIEDRLYSRTAAEVRIEMEAWDPERLFAREESFIRVDRQTTQSLG